jgi:hypothetical protein
MIMAEEREMVPSTHGSLSASSIFLAEVHGPNGSFLERIH